MDRFRDKMVSLRSNGEARRETNKFWVYFSLSVIAFLLISVTYCGINGDTKRLYNGYDSCANICGESNTNNNIPGCSKDMRTFPKLQIGSGFNDDTCVAECKNDYTEIFNRCIKVNNDGKEAGNSTLRDILITLPSILSVCALSVIFSYILLLMFRYIIDYIIWFICSAVVIIELLLTAHIWKFTVDSGCDNCQLFPITFTVLTLLTVLILFLLRNKIKLVAQIFKEASKALIDVPIIMVQPVLTFVFYIIAILIFSYFDAIISYSGTFEKLGFGSLVLVQDKFMIATHFLNAVVFIWFTQFITGCQHFIIASVVSSWYFSRDKKKLNQAVSTSYYNLIFYHLGSICLGSSLITLVKVIRMTMKSLKWLTCGTKNCCLCCIGCCIDWMVNRLEDFLKYLIRNSYILVAKNGTPFFESGRRASELIVTNLLNVVSLNYIGDLVLVLGRLFVVLITGFVGFEMMNGQSGLNSLFLPMTIVCILSLCIANCFISVFEMAIDTIFLCYCEDCDENDGSALKPYYMSPELKNIMDVLNDRVDNTLKFQSLDETVNVN